MGNRISIYREFNTGEHVRLLGVAHSFTDSGAPDNTMAIIVSESGVMFWIPMKEFGKFVSRVDKHGEVHTERWFTRVFEEKPLNK